MPSHAATAKTIMACKRLPPYVRRPVRTENIAVIDVGRFSGLPEQSIEATWRSGDAADCKSAYPGSIPGVASKT